MRINSALCSVLFLATEVKALVLSVPSITNGQVKSDVESLNITWNFSDEDPRPLSFHVGLLCDPNNNVAGDFDTTTDKNGNRTMFVSLPTYS